MVGQIVVVENGVSDERETFELQVKDGDPGGVRLTSQDADRFCDEADCPPHATTILLDDLLEVGFHVLRPARQRDIEQCCGL